MRLVLLFLCSMVLLIAQGLKSQYFISHDKITSKDLIAQAPLFEMATFGENFHLLLKTSRLEELFKKNGYPLQKSAFEEIRLSYHLPWDDGGVKDKIKSAFEKFYTAYKPQTQEINLKPIGQIKGKQIRLLSVQIDERLLKKNRFIVMIEIEVDGKKVLQPFYCEIVGSLEVYVAQKEMRAGETLSFDALELRRVDFASLLVLPATKKEILASSVKSFVAKDQILLSSKLKPKLLIKRGDWVDVVYQEGGILIEARLEAMQNGSLGEIINVKNPESKRQMKIKITGERKGRIW